VADITKGLIDTSVLIDIGSIAPDRLPGEMALSAISLAELSAGPYATVDPAERTLPSELTDLCSLRYPAGFSA
jgi:predicted nucleic acid-binding protein